MFIKISIKIFTRNLNHSSSSTATVGENDIEQQKNNSK